MTNYQTKMKRVTQLQDWDAIQEIFTEVLTNVGLSDEQDEREQIAAGKALAEYRNARDKGGRKV